MNDKESHLFNIAYDRIINEVIKNGLNNEFGSGNKALGWKVWQSVREILPSSSINQDAEKKLFEAAWEIEYEGNDGNPDYSKNEKDIYRKIWHLGKDPSKIHIDLPVKDDPQEWARLYEVIRDVSSAFLDSKLGGLHNAEQKPDPEDECGDDHCLCDEGESCPMEKECCNSAQFWKEEASRNLRNAEYYRDLVVKCGQHIGIPAHIQDDGGLSEDVLCAKVPELVGIMAEVIKAYNNELAKVSFLFKDKIPPEPYSYNPNPADRISIPIMKEDLDSVNIRSFMTSIIKEIDRDRIIDEIWYGKCR